MPDAGLKISLPGIDVITALPEECAVHSDYVSPKIKTNASPAHFNTVDFTFGSDPGYGIHNIATIPHGLGYTPAGIVFVKDFQFSPARFYQLPIHFTFSGLQQIRYGVDSTNLIIEYEKQYDAFEELFGGYISVNGFHFTFKYYLFVENGA